METTIPQACLESLQEMMGGKFPSHQQLHVPVAYTASAVDNGSTLFATVDNTVITLPKASTVRGMRVRVQAECADGASLISISPNSADAIVGSVVGITGAGAATIISSGGVADKDWLLTKATINKGDYVDLESDGVTTWYITGGIGEQVSQG
jgi:hypothetical protein